MGKKIFVNPFIIFSATALIFFWPVSALLFTLKNDCLTYYYPVRTLISDALNNGELPLWTPFINMGYPLHADMQSGAWNPVIWVFSLIGNYSLAAFHYELLFYIALAGAGFYYLCRNLGCSKTTSYSIAFAYQFSGFITDSVQFFACISAAGYIPWIILFFRRTMLEQKVPDALMLSVFLFLLFTGGYPSLFIITAYVLAFWFVFVFFSNRDKRYFLKKAMPPILISSVFFLLLSLPALISFLQHLPFIGRGKGQSLSFVLENSMNPISMLSLLSPFATTANDNWLNSSVLMRNIYLGIAPLVMLASTFFHRILRSNKEIIFFFLCAVIMTGMAWGEFFFFRQAAYYTLPLMDSFRHPALFRLFSVFFLLLISASAFKEWESNREMQTALLKKLILIIASITILGAILCAAFLNNKIPRATITISNFKSLLLQFNFQQRFLIQLPFILATLSLFYYVVARKKDARLLCFITLADLFIATQFTMPVTVIGSKKFNEVNALINRNPERFPLPGKQSIEENSARTSGEDIITGSTLPLIKKIGRNDYYISPGNLSLQDSFYESGIKNIIFENPVLYLSDSILTVPEDKNIQNNPSGFLGNKIFISTNKKSNDSISVGSFAANQIKATAVSESGGMLVCLQNYYPGWEAFVDKKQQNIYRVNISFMGIYIPPGVHDFQLKYRPGKIIIAWYISMAALGILLFWLTILFFKKRNQRNSKRKMK